MGPNGSGKSTLAQVLAGREDYEVTGGSVTFEGRDLLALPPRSARARDCSWGSNIRSRFPASTTCTC
jgi:Fe-S cluster assembly ATPase SufC